MSKRRKKEDQEFLARAMIAEKNTKDLKQVKSFLELEFQRRSASKLFDTYIKGTREAVEYNECPKVYSSFNFDGAVSGRLSCSKYTAEKPMGVSFHTLPRETNDVNIRDIYTAPPGWCFVTADEKGMELRVMAHVSKEEKMLEAFRDKKDLHTYSASLTFGVPEEKVTKDQRQIAKESSFLVIFGGTEYTLASKRRISLSRAKKVIENWYKAFPGVKSYKEYIHNFLRENKYVYSIFGRKRRLPNIDSRDRSVVAHALNQGLNFTVQSTASDILLCAILGICRDIKQEGLLDSAKFIASVHDSVELICRKEVLEDILSIVFKNMVEIPLMKEIFGINFMVPFEVDCEVGPSFGTAKAVKFSDSGEILNVPEIKSYMETF